VFKLLYLAETAPSSSPIKFTGASTCQLRLAEIPKFNAFHGQNDVTFQQYHQQHSASEKWTGGKL